MNEINNTNDPVPSVDELQIEIRALKRKLLIAEQNLQRAKMTAAAQDRVESILSDSMKKELQYFQLVLENATGIILLLDFDGRFAYASNTFLSEAGIAGFGLINGRHYMDVLKPLISEENLKKFSEAVELANAQKNTVPLEEKIDFNFNGNPRIFSILVTPMIDETGKSTGIMALFNDITEINDALGAANRANSAKSEFLANMSHEIRTPLNAILGMTAIAQSNAELEKIYYCLSKITDSSTHLLGVINDILDMSKIETNHFELSLTEFVFEKMLLRVVDVMRFKIEAKNIVFDLFCDPAIPYTVLSDEQRLAQIIMNLLSNAVKFTHENGSVTLRVEVENSSGDDYTLRISVKDSGIVISDEQKTRIFKPFSQADSSISRKFGGTGLGLVISKSIVNMLGGDIWFDSKEGEGTTFTFNIKTKSCQQSPIVRLNRGDVKILVVDDMPDVLMSFSFYAEQLGVLCSTAQSAEEALDVLKTQKYDIIFADWKMPGMDGLELVKAVNDLPDHRMVVIMISAVDWSEIEQEAKNAGVRDFISKPILLPVIEGVLEKYCGDTGGETETIDNFTDKTVLLVDDVDINREIIISLLEPTGISIICAENGREAVNVFTNDPTKFDLIFMDIQMPEMDGYEATKTIRSLDVDNARKIPIVAMTANVFKEDVERCLDSGMNDHIGKPVEIGEIINKIKQWSVK